VFLAIEVVLGFLLIGTTAQIRGATGRLTRVVGNASTGASQLDRPDVSYPRRLCSDEFAAGV
jgi:hypothetical protein